MKYYVEHLGVTITRTSDRTYTHCIVSVSSVAQGRESAEASARSNYVTNLDWWKKVVARQSCSFGATYRNHQTGLDTPLYTDEALDKMVADAQASIDLGADGHAAAAVARYDAYVAKNRKCITADGKLWVTSSTWAGRPDLAVKAAAKNGGIMIPAQVRA